MATSYQSGKEHGLQRLVREVVERQPAQLFQHRRHVPRLQNHLKKKKNRKKTKKNNYFKVSSVCILLNSNNSNLSNLSK